MVNPYFENLIFTNNNEQDLLHDLFIQSIKLSGINVIYIPRTVVNKDDLFGDDILSKFERTYPIEMYLKTYDGFTGMNSIMGPGGLMIDKNLELQVSSKRFTEELQSFPGEYVRPKEGDYIYLPFNKNLFEITFADHEERFYIYGKVYLWNLRAERIKTASGLVQTNIPDIDRINDFSNQIGGGIGIRIIRGGWKYTSTPDVQIVGACQTPASAVASINSSGSVSRITIIDPGIGYLSVPEIKIVGGGGHGAVAQAFLDDDKKDLLNNADKLKEESELFLNFDELNPFSVDGK